MNACVQRNKHRWRNWVESDRIRSVLDEAGERLRWAWEYDQEHPKTYPINALHAFDEIQEQLKPNPQPPRKLSETLRRSRRSPRAFADLVNDKIVRAVFDDQNDESYKDALEQAMTFEGGALWRKLLRAVDAAHAIDLGVEPPKPRVHFLHRNLFALANAGGIGDMTLSGLVEFFDDLCPCGKKHNQDAIRKLRRRWAGQFGVSY